MDSLLDWLVPLITGLVSGGLIRRYWQCVALEGRDDVLPDPVLMATLTRHAWPDANSPALIDPPGHAP